MAWCGVGFCCFIQTFAQFAPTTPAMRDATSLPFSFPAVEGKKITADFDGGRLTSDGVMLLSLAERRLGVAERLARFFPDRRDPTRIFNAINGVDASAKAK